MLGDANGDGVVDAADALVVMRVLSGDIVVADPNDPLSPNQLGDVSPLNDPNKDGLSYPDVTLLFRALSRVDVDGDGLDTPSENDPNVLTSPFLADTDGDFLNDGDEVDVYLTDPRDPDSDDDGFLDGAEAVAGTDPLDPNTINAPPTTPTLLDLSGDADRLDGGITPCQDDGLPALSCTQQVVAIVHPGGDCTNPLLWSGSSAVMSSQWSITGLPGLTAYTLYGVSSDGQFSSACGSGTPFATGPSVDSISGTTNDNPLMVQGTTAPNAFVTPWVNGEEQPRSSSQADPNGMYEVPAVLADGTNVVGVATEISGVPSAPTDAGTIIYVNQLARQLGTTTITSDTVWTPGTAQAANVPYVVSGTLEVDANATFTIAPGTIVRFEQLSQLSVKGDLHALGKATALVRLEADVGATSWSGINIQSTPGAAVVEYAAVDLAANAAFDVFSGATLEMSDSHITRSTSGGVRVNTGGVAVVSNTVFDNTLGGSGNGITILNGAVGSKISGSTVRGFNVRGIDVSATSPELTGNAISANTTGIRVSGNSSPLITGNEITANTVGIDINTSSDTASATLSGNAITANGVGIEFANTAPDGANPTPPVITDNQIFGNTTHDVDVNNYPDSDVAVILAPDNWWGTDDPVLISAQIEDRNEDATSATLDFRPFLSAPGGLSIGDDSLLLGIQNTATLDPNVPYTVAGWFIVPQAETLTVLDGTQIDFVAGTQLTVAGAINVNVGGGTEANVTLRSAEASPAAGDWDGVVLLDGATASRIERTVIEHVTNGVTATGQVEVHILDSEFRSFTGSAIHMTETPGQTGEIRRNLIDGTAALSDVGIHIDSPASGFAIDENEIRSATEGIRIHLNADPNVMITANTIGKATPGEGNYATGIQIRSNSSPTISGGNTITGAASAIKVLGQGLLPSPLVQGNTLEDNGKNYDAVGPFDANTPLLAPDNFWGTVVVTEIEASITAPATRPVNFFPYVGEDPNSGTNIGGAQSGTLADPLYQVIGDLIVDPNDTLTIAAGTTLRFTQNASLQVDGTLVVSGTALSKVILTSITQPAAPGSWPGVFVGPGGSATIQHAEISGASTSIQIDGGTGVLIADTTLSDYASAGIRVQNASDPNDVVIQANTIGHSGVGGTGIRIEDASPTITGGNLITGGFRGILIQGDSSPSITGGNVIDDNTWGVEVQASASGPPHPSPIVNQNDLTNNTNGAVRLRFFEPDDSLTLDFRENWWGIPITSTIRDDIRSLIVLEAVFGQVVHLPVDFSDYLDASIGSSGVPATNSSNAFTQLLQSFSRVPDTFAPTLGGTVKVTVTPAAPVASIAVDIRTEDTDVLVYQEFRSGAPTLPAGVPQEFDWNGTDNVLDPNAFVPDEAYAFEITLIDEAGFQSRYDPVRSPSAAHDGPFAASYAPFRNDFLKLSASNFSEPARVTLGITPEGGAEFFPIQGVPVATPTYLYSWDGRDPSGAILTSPVEFYAQRPVPLRPNYIIVDQVTPEISGELSAPQVEVKSDPYRIFHSYEQVSRIAYCLDQTAKVTMKLLRPGFSDPDDPAAVVHTFIDNENRGPTDCQGSPPVVHVEEWRGHDEADTNDVLVDGEGSYTFTIKATSVVDPSFSTLYRGVLQLRR